jgi:molybdenum cofactor cytidylyltransferase
MKFGIVDTADAEGAILAHSVRLADGVFKKGRQLSAGDVRALAAADIQSVMAARLEAGDVAEDAAAGRIARAATGEGATAAAPFTGRANIFAAAHGLAVVDTARVDALNALSENVTIATVRPFEPVQPRQMLATVKIIPFAADEDDVTAAERVSTEPGPLVQVAPFGEYSVGLVLTRLPQTRDQVVAKSRGAIEERLTAAGSILAQTIECAHETGAVAQAIADLLERQCSPVLLFGASAIVDRGDVIPAAVVRAGGDVVHLGMPVDPGNLMMLGRCGEATIIGVPSCARSPKINGFDWVLQRVLANVPVSGVDVAAMGAGGLLKEIPSRPAPREGRQNPEAPRAPAIAAVVLAAGRSRRMGDINKLLEHVDGTAMVRRACEVALDSTASEVVVVVGHEAARVRAELHDLDVRFAVNEDYAEGLSTSLNAGVGALGETVDGAVVCLGDMPFVSSQLIDRLIAAFDPAEGRGICVPVVNGKRGNPVLWAAKYFDEMASVRGDVGARHLLGQYSEDVCEVATNERGVMMDIDTPQALAAVADGDDGPAP